MPCWVYALECLQDKPIGAGLRTLQGLAVNFTSSCQMALQGCWVSFYSSPIDKESSYCCLTGYHQTQAAGCKIYIYIFLLLNLYFAVKCQGWVLCQYVYHAWYFMCGVCVCEEQILNFCPFFYWVVCPFSSFIVVLYV